jgi:uncharacterized RDD family membrane protein YckC
MEPQQPEHVETRPARAGAWDAALAFELIAPLLIGIAILVVLILAFLMASTPTD